MPESEIDTDTGYQGIAKLHAKSVLPEKKTTKNPPDKAGKAFNRAVLKQAGIKRECDRMNQAVSDCFGQIPQPP
ncbi:MAG: hypothetical protein Pg6A_13180 [Termitinemataceae bacterium]|nr:MAG: hypothetical protein Pg6A_13180 [Termitinemataceae bacterium]